MSSRIRAEIHDLHTMDQMKNSLVLASFMVKTSQPKELNREADKRVKEVKMKKLEADDE